ncbi:MAG: hypothetical protein NVSMB46_02620 [Candidatus Saccharimonadales bacterium]
MQKSVAAIKRHRTARLARLITHAYYLHKRGLDERMYNLVCEEFMALGGVYVKFLQGVLLRSKVMRRWQNPEKLRIFENLDTEPLDIASILEHELTSQQRALLKSINPVPFAAGSFGQVYYGELKTNQPIIIKVLRPMVRELLKYDLRLLSAFSRTFFTKLYKNMNIQLDDALKEFRSTTLRETDYKHEVDFASEMYEVYKKHDYFIIPRTYSELCTPNIIVQDFVDGISVAQLIKLKQQGVEPFTYVQETIGSNLDAQLQILGYESLMGIFSSHRIQGDPHPGNIRLLSNNRVGIIDFGISARAPGEKGALFGMLEAYDRLFKGSATAVVLFEQGLRFFVSDLYRSLKKLASIYGSKTDQDYLKDISRVAAEAFSQVTGNSIVDPDYSKNENVLTIINSIVNKGNRFGLVMKLESSDIIRAIQTYTTLVSSLGRFQQVIPSTMDHVIQDVRNDYPEVLTDNDDHIAVADAIEIILNWLERVAERDPALFRQLVGTIRTKGRPLGNLSVKEP